MSGAKVGAEIERNSKAVLRVDLEVFKGHQLCGCREWVRHPETGQLTATPRGVSVPMSILPALAKALADAEHEARAMGWLDAEIIPANDDTGGAV